jgi:acyl-CoA reductase-like NAD-dependent aldehyde dehydrogenase
MSERVTVREFAIGPDRWVVDADFAHRLADELAEARERIEELEALLTGEKWIAADAKALSEVIRIVEAKP